MADPRPRPFARRARAALALAVAAAALGPVASAAAQPVVARRAGPDRYATAAAISRSAFGPGVPAAYVATGRDFPDALAAGPAAEALDGPVLLVDRAAVPAVVRDEFARLRPGRIVVLGGEAAVSTGVQAELGAYTAGPVVRLAGANRYATAAAVSAATFAPGVATTAYVATGEGFADALAGGAAAAARGAPVLLTAPGALPAPTAAELDRLDLSRIVVLGGQAAVSAAVEAALRPYAQEVVRLAGPDRYATAAAVSRDAFAGPRPQAYLATGAGFADALAGSAAAGNSDVPLLLVPPTCAPAAVRDELARLAPSTVVVLGGPAAVSDAAASGRPCAAALDPNVRVTLDGVGAVRVGMSLAEAEAATGQRFALDVEFNPGCNFATPQGGPPGLSFMVLDGRIARTDVFGASPVATRSGVRIGATEAEVKAAYPGRIVVEPHPYTGPEGHYLRYVPADEANRPYSLIFETDGERVTSYRAGEAEAVSYIEGCA